MGFLVKKTKTVIGQAQKAGRLALVVTGIFKGLLKEAQGVDGGAAVELAFRPRVAGA